MQQFLSPIFQVKDAALTNEVVPTGRLREELYPVVMLHAIFV